MYPSVCSKHRGLRNKLKDLARNPIPDGGTRTFCGTTDLVSSTDRALFRIEKDGRDATYAARLELGSFQSTMSKSNQICPKKDRDLEGAGTLRVDNLWQKGLTERDTCGARESKGMCREPLSPKRLRRGSSYWNPKKEANGEPAA